MERKAVVSGTFYEASPEILKKNISQMADGAEKKLAAFGIIAPHAGYVYSGIAAAKTYTAVKIPKSIILLGPNHTGLGDAISVFNKGSWLTPLGRAVINEKIAKELIETCKYASADTKAHEREHSIEVHLPFIQYHRQDFDFVPVCIGDYNLEHLRDLAQALAKVVKGKEILIAASTDLTHYEEAKEAKKKDLLILNSIEKLDPEKMWKDVEDFDISMCGVAAVYTLLHACKILGAKEGRIIKYMNSGDASNDFSSVVGYAGAVII